MIDFKYLISVCVILLGGTLWLLKPIFNLTHARQDGVLKILMTLVCGLALLSYTRFGELHPIPGYGNQNFHMAEVFVYYIGSKYFDKTGHFDLYNCSAAAILEMQAENPAIQHPTIVSVRDLRNKANWISKEQINTHYRRWCPDRFGERRWRQFKEDIRAMISVAPHDGWWRTTLFDAGYNSSPVFASLAGPLAKLVPLDRTWKHMGWFDMLLIFSAACGIFWAFGIYPLFAFILVFATNPLSNYIWIGGSFLRLLWMATLAWALCFLKKEKYALAGIFFAYSVADRFLPIPFFVGACIPLAVDSVRKRKIDRPLWIMAASFLASLFCFILFSLLLYGIDSWKDFFQNLGPHTHPFWVPHLGLKKVLTYFPGIEFRNFWYEKGSLTFFQWSDSLYALLRKRYLWYLTAAAFLGLGSFWSSLTKPPQFAALLFGGTLIYIFSMPARYYYSYLALFPVVLYQFPSDSFNNIRLISCFALIFALLVIPMLPPDDILLHIYFSWALGVFFTFLIVTDAFEQVSLMRHRESGRRRP